MKVTLISISGYLKVMLSISSYISSHFSRKAKYNSFFTSLLLKNHSSYPLYILIKTGHSSSKSSYTLASSFPLSPPISIEYLNSPFISKSKIYSATLSILILLLPLISIFSITTNHNLYIGVFEC